MKARAEDPDPRGPEISCQLYPDSESITSLSGSGSSIEIINVETLACNYSRDIYHIMQSQNMWRGMVAEDFGEKTKKGGICIKNGV